MKDENSSQFEPKILGFLCNWCSYAGADLAGVSRVQYPPNIRVIRVMCSGRVDPALVIEALENGIDGVLIAGCHPGDCHYQTGNYQTKRRYDALTEALTYTGLEEGRIRLEWVSASEGVRFGEVITDFTLNIKALGPNPIGNGSERGKDLLNELRAVKGLFNEHSSRTLIGKQGELTEQGNVYNEKVDAEKFERIIMDSVKSGYARNFILLSTMTESKSVKELAAKLNMNPQKVLKEVSVLRRKNLLAMEKIDGTTPRYISLVQEVDA